VSIGIAGYSILGLRDLPTPALGEVIGRFARNVGVAALLGAFGVGVGSLIRNQPTAIVVILVLAFVVDPLLGHVAPGVDRYSPVGSAPSAIQGVSPDDVGTPKVNFLPVLPAIAVMAAWIGAVFAGGAALLRARDVE